MHFSTTRISQEIGKQRSSGEPRLPFSVKEATPIALTFDSRGSNCCTAGGVAGKVQVVNSTNSPRKLHPRSAVASRLSLSNNEKLFLRKNAFEETMDESCGSNKKAEFWPSSAERFRLSGSNCTIDSEKIQLLAGGIKKQSFNVRIKPLQVPRPEDPDKCSSDLSADDSSSLPTQQSIDQHPLFQIADSFTESFNRCSIEDDPLEDEACLQEDARRSIDTVPDFIRLLNNNKELFLFSQNKR